MRFVAAVIVLVSQRRDAARRRGLAVMRFAGDGAGAAGEHAPLRRLASPGARLCPHLYNRPSDNILERRRGGRGKRIRVDKRPTRTAAGAQNRCRRTHPVARHAGSLAHKGRAGAGGSQWAPGHRRRGRVRADQGRWARPVDAPTCAVRPGQADQAPRSGGRASRGGAGQPRRRWPARPGSGRKVSPRAKRSIGSRRGCDTGWNGLPNIGKTCAARRLPPVRASGGTSPTHAPPQLLSPTG